MEINPKMDLYEEIAKAAYELYKKRGKSGGNDLADWLEAEKIVKARYIRSKNNDLSVINGDNAGYAGDEKRKHKRFSIKGIQRKFLHSANIKILDISAGGVAVEAARKLDVNRDYSLNINYKGNPLRLRCRVVWSALKREERKESGETIRIYKGGMKFQRSSAVVNSR
jgi:hypothetical protein